MFYQEYLFCKVEIPENEPELALFFTSQFTKHPAAHPRKESFANVWLL